jgi:mono/diheme cytochrome c family protein
MTPLEIKGAVAAVVTSVVILVATFTAGGIYRNHRGGETELGGKPLVAEDLAAKGRGFFLRSCAQCHGRDADGGEDAPSLLNLQISGAHMTLVIQSGIKGEMPSFSKKYDAQDTAAIVAYLKSVNKGVLRGGGP